MTVARCLPARMTATAKLHRHLGTKTGVSTQFQCRLRWQSSASAALLEEDEVVIPTRPRLEALRQKLQQENARNGISPSGVGALNNNNIGSSISGTRSTSTPRVETYVQPKNITQEVQSSDSELATDLNDLIKQLDALPVPQEPLMDRYGRQHSYLRISLSEKCNLRCLYCMPEDGVPVQPQSHLLNNDEIMKLATWFADQGVDKVRLTGGEPLLRKDLVDLVSRLNGLGLEQIGMTTNGVTLSKNLPDLVAAGLTHVNISLDSLEPDKFARLTRRPPSYHNRVMQAIEDCAQLLPHRTKINCVVMPDNVDELEDFAELTRSMPIDVRFIEFMPFNDNLWQTDEFISYQQMQDQIPGLQRLVDGPNDTTKWWNLSPLSSSDAGALGRIGFITSMTEHFCGTCNRLRLTADGKLKVCLFGKTEVSLRDLMRSGASEESLQKLIHHSVQKKHFKLGGHKDMDDLKAHSTENRPMTLIGG